MSELERRHLRSLPFNPYNAEQYAANEKATYDAEQAALVALWNRLAEWGHAWFVDPASGGFTVSCTCGWRDPATYPDQEAALKAHDQHRKDHR